MLCVFDFVGIQSRSHSLVGLVANVLSCYRFVRPKTKRHERHRKVTGMEPSRMFQIRAPCSVAQSAISYVQMSQNDILIFLLRGIYFDFFSRAFE